MRKPPFELFKSDLNGQWYWRIKAKNGNILAVSGEGYKRRRDAKGGFDAMCLLLGNQGYVL